MLNGFTFGPQFGSSMFVFTDAAPKDVDNMKVVIDAGFGFNTKISFFVLKNTKCGGQLSDYSKFQEVAKETGGRIIFFINSLFI